MVRLERLPEDRLPAWLEQMWDGYRAALAEAGYAPAEIEANIERNSASLLVDGRLKADQHVLDVYDGEQVVGNLWLAPRADEGASEQWYVYNVEIDDAVRGRGLGRATMRAAEEYVRDQGGQSLGLNVFGYNTVARSLYESLGYRTLALQMRKDLS